MIEQSKMRDEGTQFTDIKFTLTPNIIINTLSKGKSKVNINKYITFVN